MYPLAIPMSFRWIIIGAVGVNSVMTYMFEKIIVWYLSLWWKGIQETKKEKEFNE